jgi:hypothetical protein
MTNPQEYYDLRTGREDNEAMFLCESGIAGRLDDFVFVSLFLLRNDAEIT